MSWETYAPPLDEASPVPEHVRLGVRVAWAIFCACTLLQLAVIVLSRPRDRLGSLLVMDIGMMLFGPIVAYFVTPLLPDDAVRPFGVHALLASLLMLALMILVDAAALGSSDLLGFR